MTDTTALVICPPQGNALGVGTPLLGLTVGERLLLSLEFGGIDRVLLAGPGPRPASARITIPAIDLADHPVPSDLGSEVLVLTADLVFDRKLIDAPAAALSDLPLGRVASPDLPAILADPMRWLEGLGSGSAVTGQGFAIRIKDKFAMAPARRSLLLSLRKPIDGMVSRHLNRHVSLFLSRFIVLTGVRPTPLTIAFTFLGALSGVFAAFPEHGWSLLVAGLLFQAQSILDGVDGEIARLTYRFSTLGQWLDSIADDITNYGFYLGLAVGLYRYYDAPWLLVLGIATFLAEWGASGIQYFQLIKLGSGDLLAIPDHYSPGADGKSWGPVTSFLRALLKRDAFVFLLALLAAVQLPSATLAIMTLGSWVMFFGVALNCRRNLKEGLLVKRA